MFYSVDHQQIFTPEKFSRWFEIYACRKEKTKSFENNFQVFEIYMCVVVVHVPLRVIKHT